PTATFTPIFAASTSAPTVTAPMATAPISVPTSAPTIQPSFANPTAPAMASSTASAAAPVDAVINITAGPHPLASSLTSGNSQPWSDSPSVIHPFGGVPNAQQQSSFVQTVLQDVHHAFQLSGMNPAQTTDPNMPALHTLSVASGLSDASN